MNEPVYTNVSIRAEDEEDDEFFLDTIEVCYVNYDL